ncbi:MAG: DUF4034 domain-containing protein [Acidobacteria bacterium]|nr:DUF4034 domain-containing protein [Acidobacteriota bacterium]
MKSQGRLAVLIALCVVLFVVVVGVVVQQVLPEIIQQAYESQKPAKAKKAQKRKPRPPSDIVPTPAIQQQHKEFSDFQKQVTDLFKQNKFAELDQLAGELRKSKARFTAGGSWKIFRLYYVLDSPLDIPDGEEPTETDWQTYLKKVEGWAQQSPNSITAQVLHADALTGYAWFGRGIETAPHVSDAQWKMFHERLDLAEQVLLKAKALPVKCPMWYYTMQTVALGQGWEIARYDQLFNEATAFEPKFFGYYTAKAYYLLPRWYGEEGDWEAFAEETRLKIGGKEGASLYYRIAMSQLDYYKPEDYFNETNISWLLMRDGYLATEELYGRNIDALHTTAKFAFWAQDRESLKVLLEKIGNDVEPECWPSMKAFQEFKDWGMGKTEKMPVVK